MVSKSITPESTKVNAEIEAILDKNLNIDLDFACTDQGNAERLIHRFGPILRHSWQRGKWLKWNGKCWEWDDGENIAFYAQLISRSIYYEAAGASTADRREELSKHAVNSENAHRIAGMIDLARSCHPSTPIKLDALDRDSFLFNVNNGTIDLTTGTLKPHDSNDLITRLVPIDYDPEAQCPMWTKFLDDFTDGDKDLTDYLQLIFGVCLTGDMLDQIFFYLYGLGQNGKSTLTDRLLEITGDYGMRVDSEMFMLADRGRGGATEGIANIRGRRVIVSSEVPEGRTLNTG